MHAGGNAISLRHHENFVLLDMAREPDSGINQTTLAVDAKDGDRRVPEYLLNDLADLQRGLVGLTRAEPSHSLVLSVVILGLADGFVKRFCEAFVAQYFCCQEEEISAGSFTSLLDASKSF